MAMTPEEWEAERRKNDATGKHGRGGKGQNEAKPGGDRRDNQGHPRSDQRDDRYDD